MTSANKRSDRGKRVASPPETPEIAVSLARAGWPVFPVTIYEDDSGKRHKVPAVKWKEWATTDPKTVAKAWAGEHSGRWIGVYAGKAGIVVLDLDPERTVTDRATGKKRRASAGVDSLAAAGLEIPETFTYATQRKGGRHHVYAAPEGIELTIGADIVGPDGAKLEGVDVRAGSGLMVYYGPELTEPPRLAPAPDWLLVTRERERHNGGVDRDVSATEDAFRARLADGKPRKGFAKLIRGVEFPQGAAHEPMLEVVAALVGEGVKGTPGVLRLLDETRDRYVAGGPDRARDWENAIAGSVKRFGLPPMTLELTKAERREIKKRNDPDAIEKRTKERKAEYRIQKHAEALTDIAVARPDPGTRVLEDGPLAEELASVLEATWCYARGYGLMRWRGDRWASAEEHSLVEAVRTLIQEIEIGEHEIAVRRGDKPGIAKALSLLSRSRASAVARLVIGILAEHEPEFDAHPDLLNTPTCIVDLRTGEALPHDPKLYMTKITGVGYDPDADMTLWERALEAVPKSVRPWLQVRFGQAATGYTPDDDTLLIFEGAGSNGKTTIMIGPRRALGDYAVTLPERLLLANPGDHPTTLMTLQGARLGVIEELPEGRSLNVKRLKDAVGTPEITAHRMRQDDVTFPTTHCLMLSTNYLPIVAETDHGTWRRLALVRFPIRFVKKKSEIQGKRDRVGDPNVKRHFETVADAGALRWIVEGAVQWYADGKRFGDRPDRVIRDSHQWREDADPVLAYVKECLVRDVDTAIPSADLADDFNTWLERRGHKRWTQQTVNSRFGGHVAMDGVERKTVQWSRRVRPSRPAFALRPIPATTTAWRGVRFREDAHLKSEAEKDAETLADLETRLR